MTHTWDFAALSGEERRTFALSRSEAVVIVETSCEGVVAVDWM